MNYPFHPLAEIFPLLEGEQFDELVADIKANGLRHDIALLGDKIIDGRNRYRACMAAGVRPTFVHLPNIDPIKYVISANIHRRHLTAEQRRALAAKVLQAKPEQSDRQVSNVVKLDHKTVGSVRADMERRGEIPHVETRTDTRGRQQTSKKKREVAERQPVEVKTNPIASAWINAAVKQRCEFALSYRTEIMLAQQRGGLAGPAADRAEAVRLAADRAEAVAAQRNGAAHPGDAP